MQLFQLLTLSLWYFLVSNANGFSSRPLQQSASKDDELIFAHVIYRHGDRNIDKAYPNDPYKDEATHWSEGFGQLTNEGKRQQFKLGQFLRRRYDDLVGQKYSPNKVYVQSTDFDRTIMSAQANLAGLFPPNEGEIWNENLAWQPIPVRTTPRKLDYALLGPKNCSKFDVAFERYLEESQEVQQINTKYVDHFKHWTKMSGSKVKKIRDVYSLYNTLYVEELHNKTLPSWAQKAVEPNGPMEYIAQFYYKMGADTPQLARIQSGFLIKEILERFTQKINSTLKPDRSLWLYSGHDLTISYMLHTLGLFKLHIPAYASSLHFELYKTNVNEVYFSLFYRKSNEKTLFPMNIPKCGEKCRIDRFYEEYSQIIPNDYDTECY